MKAKKRGKLPGKPARAKTVRAKKPAPRINVTEREELYRLQAQMTAVLSELFDARAKLASCRQIMEANDPLNARNIFGPPLDGEPPVDPVPPLEPTPETGPA